MTDQTIPADKVRDIITAWGTTSPEHRTMDDANTIINAIVDLLPTPPPRTLADMTPEERDECTGMQADLAQGDRVVILDGTPDHDDRVQVLESTFDVFRPLAVDVTPRPDLPRMTWPGDTPAPAAPALPEGWRLADHPEHGRVIVTTPEPDDSGDVEFACHAPEGIRGGWFGECLPDELTFLDGANYRALAERNDEKVC